MITAEQVTFSVHARQRLKEHFNVTNLYAARKWIATKLKRAKYLGITVDTKGNEARMFGGRGAVILLDLNSDHVVTVHPPEKHTAIAFLRASFDEMRKTVEAAVQNNESYAAELHEEIAQLMAELKRTRSKAKKMAYQARINAVQMRIDELPAESFELKRKLTKAAKGVAAYV
ncbi:hypothetical protein [Bacillus subtilis]|uniref:hypothetical protein n=1 Tax=Bacillus subtilis TaxID=1423 RepID=UPI0024C04EDA|nr:hypothetical protein [Bacillus subtilis]MDK1004060.1 hypothetical protein [Bacillus subtilis]